jgi:hypothetical protein
LARIAVMGSNMRPTTLDPIRELGRFRARQCPAVFRQWVAGDRRGQEAYHQDWGKSYHGDHSRLRNGSEPPRSFIHIVAAVLTTSDTDDGAQVGPLIDKIDGPIASFTGDGAYNQDGLCGEITAHHPDAAVIVPPRSSAVPSETARDCAHTA